MQSKCSKKFKSNNLEKERKILKQNEEITTSLSQLINLLQSTDIGKFQPILTNEHLAILNDEDVYTNVTDQDIYKINFLYDKDNKRNTRDERLFKGDLRCWKNKTRNWNDTNNKFSRNEINVII